jgi:multidrug efflux system membrane fusion protein
MKRSAFISIGLVLIVSLWMLSGTISRSVPHEPVEEKQTQVAPMKVLVNTLSAQPVVREIVVQGDLEPRRLVDIRAETAGRVVELPVEKGAQVAKGELLMKLSEDDRPAQIARVKAQIASFKLEVEGARKLQKEGYQSRTQLKTAEANLAAARAELEALQIDLDRTQIKAPFDGVLEDRFVEKGSLVERGDAVVSFVDKQTLEAVGYIPQQSANRLAIGQPVKVRLLDGGEAEATISYISSVAESGTRSFRIEADVPNPELKLAAGVSAEIRISVSQEMAHFISPAALTLNDRGEVGIKAVNSENHVEFYPISLVRTDADGVWVSGLPGTVNIIVQGQGFVAQDELVEPVQEEQS